MATGVVLSVAALYSFVNGFHTALFPYVPWLKLCLCLSGGEPLFVALETGQTSTPRMVLSVFLVVKFLSVILVPLL